MESALGIPAYGLLDPRSAVEAATSPIVDAVNIPATELASRTLELPPRRRLVPVAAVGDSAAAAVAWLRSNDREAELSTAFEYAAAGIPVRPGRLWTPTAFLSDVAAELLPGRALDVACGTGRDAVYLASLGWDVRAADILPDALALGATLEQRYRRAMHPIRWLRADFESADGPLALDDAPRRLDLHGALDLITVFRFLHRPLLPTLLTWLAPHGSLLCETFTTLHRERHGKPARDAHVLHPGELRTLAGAMHVRLYDEGWRADGSHTARLWLSRAAH